MQKKNVKLVDKLQQTIKCKRSSCRTYASVIKRVANQFGQGFNEDMKWSHDKKILGKIKKFDTTLNVKRNLVNAMLNSLKLHENATLYKQYSEYLVELNKEVDEFAKSGKLTDKQQKTYLSFDKIIKLRRLIGRKVRLSQAYKREKVTPQTHKLLTRWIVLNLYTLLPPVRLSWATVTFHNEKGIGNARQQLGNYLAIRRGNWRVYWNEHKSSRKHGTVEVEIPKNLVRVLRPYIKYLKKHFPENANLLLNSRYEPMSKASLSAFLQTLFYSHFRKRIGAQAIRRIFLSHKYRNQDKERAEVARQMLHDESTQRLFYVKDNKQND